MKKIIFVILLMYSAYSYAQTEQSIVGTWQLKSVIEKGKTHTGMQAVWIFDKDDILKAARSTSHENIVVGKWEVDENNKKLIMKSSLDKDFNGQAEILYLKDNKLSYKKDDVVLNFERVEIQKQDNTPIPKLTFTQDIFYNGDEYAYPNEDEKLPWSFEQIYSNMKEIKEIIYTVDKYKPQKGKVSSLINGYKVTFFNDENGDFLSVREYSYSHKGYIDMTENRYLLNDQTSQLKEFYPRTKPDLFRIVGIEDCETSIGIYSCTVVEAIGRFDEKIKYWMINDKPGVFAKIIIVTENDTPFDNTKIYTLKEIK